MHASIASFDTRICFFVPPVRERLGIEIRRRSQRELRSALMQTCQSKWQSASPSDDVCFGCWIAHRSTRDWRTKLDYFARWRSVPVFLCELLMRKKSRTNRSVRVKAICMESDDQRRYVNRAWRSVGLLSLLMLLALTCTHFCLPPPPSSPKDHQHTSPLVVWIVKSSTFSVNSLNDVLKRVFLIL